MLHLLGTNAIFDEKTQIICNLEIAKKSDYGGDLSSAEGVKGLRRTCILNSNRVKVYLIPHKIIS